jgi:hypothetical protein
MTLIFAWLPIELPRRLPGALLPANLLAALPGRWAALLPVHRILRAE